MTTTTPDTPHSDPANTPLALKLTEGLGPTPRVPACTCHPSDNPPRPCPGMHALGACFQADNERLRAALEQYANPLNWDADSDGIRRVWLEPGSQTPDAYNGFEAAQSALRPNVI